MFRRRVQLKPLQRLRELVWPRSGWRRTFQYGWRRVWRLSGTPHAIALGVAAGAFASFTPFIGFHFMIAFLVAWIIRGNLIASAFGTFVGNPVTFPFIWISTYDVGVWVLGREPQTQLQPMDLSLDLLANEALSAVLPILKPMTIGSLPLGVLAAAICYVPVRSAVETYQGRRRALLAERARRRQEGGEHVGP